MTQLKYLRAIAGMALLPSQKATGTERAVSKLPALKLAESLNQSRFQNGSTAHNLRNRLEYEPIVAKQALFETVEDIPLVARETTMLVQGGYGKIRQGQLSGSELNRQLDNKVENGKNCFFYYWQGVS